MVIWVNIYFFTFLLYSCHLFLISSGSLGPYHFCPLLCPSLMKSSFGISNFLEEISSLSHSIVFLCFFALTLRTAFLSLLAIHWNSAFRWIYLSFFPLPFTSLLCSAVCKASADNHFAFLQFLFLGDAPPVQCYKPPSVALQELCK